MRLRDVRSAGLLFGMALLSACASSAPRTGVDSSLAPAMTVERFLRAANQNDLDTMASLFGNKAGPVTRTWSRKEVDDRMLLLANVLRHTDYTIAGEQIVAGRRGEATQLNVRLVINGSTHQVPFVMVLTDSQNWLIENIDITAVTGRRSGS